MTCHVDEVFLHVCAYQCRSVNATLAADSNMKPQGADAVCKLNVSLDRCLCHFLPFLCDL